MQKTNYQLYDRIFTRAIRVVDCVVTDNATQFTSSEFRDFCKTYQVDHITTRQYHSRSNWQAESFVDTLKRALKRH